MQRLVPYSCHLDDEKPRALPSVYAADLELSRGASSTTNYALSGFRGTVPYAEKESMLRSDDSGKLPRTKYSSYADSPLYYSSTAGKNLFRTESLWTPCDLLRRPFLTI
ncbi:unnamed protein product [Heligmosomoides polygyrus]|uniref:Uncharacterized protein n=1 Tax=Heligmosomoides polygyrus TaxID=6339 RepID=A0A183GE90_HELPZ|nr:unnamed protein product [Heligmosomoides polygyrus]